jgi:hypothetical protein
MAPRIILHALHRRVRRRRGPAGPPALEGGSIVSWKIPVAALIAALVQFGCSSPEPAGPRVDVSIGQQLIELKEAHDAGALTDKEYVRQKKQLIENAR